MGKQLPPNKRKALKATPICTIYALCDADDKIRYIGQTKNLGLRMKFYKKAVRAGVVERMSPVERWLWHEKQSGRPMNVKVITDQGVWDVSEIVWIERAKAAGHDLLNCTRGGKDSREYANRDKARDNRYWETGFIC